LSGSIEQLIIRLLPVLFPSVLNDMPNPSSEIGLNGVPNSSAEVPFIETNADTDGENPTLRNSREENERGVVSNYIAFAPANYV
jgi:hypothetical protein